MIQQLLSLIVPMIEDILRAQQDQGQNGTYEGEEKQKVEPTAVGALNTLPTFILTEKRKKRMVEQFLISEYMEHRNCSATPSSITSPTSHTVRSPTVQTNTSQIESPTNTTENNIIIESNTTIQNIHNSNAKIKGHKDKKHQTMETIASQLVMTKEQYEEIFSCSLCLDQYHLEETLLKLPCKHLFHDECIRKWITDHNTCPICRYELPVEEPGRERGRRKRMEKRFTAPGLRLLEIGQDVERLAEIIYQLEDEEKEAIPISLLKGIDVNLSGVIDLLDETDCEGKIRQQRRALIVFIQHLQHIVDTLKKQQHTGQLQTTLKRKRETPIERFMSPKKRK